MIDLEQEVWAAVENVRRGHLNRIEALGVPRSAFANLGAFQPPLGVQRVQWLSDGLYRPDPAGEAAALTPACHIGPDGLVQFVDLIAWKTSKPADWRWRIGQAWALGEYLLDDDLPVAVVSTPLDWLKAGGEALCILDWSAPPQFWARVRTGPPLQFRDEITRQLVRNTLVATAPMPMMEMSHAA